MTKSDVRIEGLDNVLAMFNELPEKIQADLLEVGVRKGLSDIAFRVSSNAPYGRGYLRKSIKVSIRRSVKYGVRGEVRVRAFYGKFLEFGADPHWIEAADVKLQQIFSDQELGDLYRAGSQKLRRALKFRQFFGVRVWHPGIRGRGFMRRSWDESKEQAIEKIKSSIRGSVWIMAQTRRRRFG